MSGVNEAQFHQTRWHFGVLEYIEVSSTPGSSALGETAAESLQEFFRKGLALNATATVPHFVSGSFPHPYQIRVWIGIEMHGNKYVALLHVSNATPLRKGYENIVVSGEHRGGLVLIEEPIDLTYNGETKTFLNVGGPTRT